MRALRACCQAPTYLHAHAQPESVFRVLIVECRVVCCTYLVLRCTSLPSHLWRSEVSSCCCDLLDYLWGTDRCFAGARRPRIGFEEPGRVRSSEMPPAACRPPQV